MKEFEEENDSEKNASESNVAESTTDNQTDNLDREEKGDNLDKNEYKDEVDDVLEKLHEINKKYVPYRDAKEEKAGDHNSDTSSDDNDDNFTVTSTIMDPQMVRAKMRRSILGRLKKERRRIKNKGESSLITSRNRDIKENIQSYFE